MRHLRIPKICLGTAAMGLEYGTFVKNKKPSKKHSYQILTTAWKNGINCIDTAHNYGSAEKTIGGWSKKKNKKPIIITKLPSCLLYTSPSPRDGLLSRMPSSA